MGDDFALDFACENGAFGIAFYLAGRSCGLPAYQVTDIGHSALPNPTRDSYSLTSKANHGDRRCSPVRKVVSYIQPGV